MLKMVYRHKEQLKGASVRRSMASYPNGENRRGIWVEVLRRKESVFIPWTDCVGWLLLLLSIFRRCGSCLVVSIVVD